MIFEMHGHELQALFPNLALCGDPYQEYLRQLNMTEVS